MQLGEACMLKVIDHIISKTVVAVEPCDVDVADSAVGNASFPFAWSVPAKGMNKNVGGAQHKPCIA